MFAMIATKRTTKTTAQAERFPGVRAVMFTA
jgi:hypothetical protein